jgi:GntR family transcriptional repressor for pyruvate dehydrogenase complex
MIVAAPVRRRKLYEEVVERIEAAVLDGQLQEGSALPSERELMRLFGVGRTAIREALFALERKGFISITNGECARVSNPTPATMIAELSGAAKRLLRQPSGVRQFQQARMLLECGLARFAAENATAAQLAELAAALEANRKALSDQTQFDRTDMHFHFVIAQVPRNPIFEALHAALHEWLFEQRSVAGSMKGGPQKAYKAHARIYAAIAEKDPDAAGRSMRDHLEEIAARYWLLKGEPPG